MAARVESIGELDDAASPPFAMLLDHPGMGNEVAIVLGEGLAVSPGVQVLVERIVGMEMEKHDPAPAGRSMLANADEGVARDVDPLVDVEDVEFRLGAGPEQRLVQRRHALMSPQL